MLSNESGRERPTIDLVDVSFVVGIVIVFCLTAAGGVFGGFRPEFFFLHPEADGKGILVGTMVGFFFPFSLFLQWSRIYEAWLDFSLRKKEEGWAILRLPIVTATSILSGALIGICLAGTIGLDSALKGGAYFAAIGLMLPTLGYTAFKALPLFLAVVFFAGLIGFEILAPFIVPVITGLGVLLGF